MFNGVVDLPMEVSMSRRTFAFGSPWRITALAEALEAFGDDEAIRKVLLRALKEEESARYDRLNAEQRRAGISPADKKG